LELRWRINGNWVLSAFHDRGEVSNREGSPSYALAGNGLSLAWQTSAGPMLRATLARRAGSNPNPTATGNDQDGSLQPDRLWLSMSLPL